MNEISSKINIIKHNYWKNISRKKYVYNTKFKNLFVKLLKTFQNKNIFICKFKKVCKKIQNKNKEAIHRLFELMQKY